MCSEDYLLNRFKMSFCQTWNGRESGKTLPLRTIVPIERNVRPGFGVGWADCAAGRSVGMLGSTPKLRCWPSAAEGEGWPLVLPESPRFIGFDFIRLDRKKFP